MRRRQGEGVVIGEKAKARVSCCRHCCWGEGDGEGVSSLSERG